MIWLRPPCSILRVNRFRSRSSRSMVRAGTEMAGNAGITPTRVCTLMETEAPDG